MEQGCINAGFYDPELDKYGNPKNQQQIIYQQPPQEQVIPGEQPHVRTVKIYLSIIGTTLCTYLLYPLIGKYKVNQPKTKLNYRTEQNGN